MNSAATVVDAYRDFLHRFIWHYAVVLTHRFDKSADQLPRLVKTQFLRKLAQVAQELCVLQNMSHFLSKFCRS